MVNAFALKRPGEQTPVPQTQNAFVNRTAPAPAAAVAPPMPNAFAMQPARKPVPGGDMFKAFATGLLGPERIDAMDQAHQAKGDRRAQQTLALMQQQRALPEEQRVQWWQQNAPQISEIIGQDVSQIPLDPTKFTNQALDGQIAVLAGQLGIAPEKPAGPDYQFLQGPDGAISRGDRTSGDLTQLQAGTPKPEAPVKWEQYTDATGQVWDRNPYTGESRKAPVPRARVPSEGGGSGIGSFRTLTPDEVKQRGYTPGTVVQVDGRGKEYVNARPSTAQTGQPTESERSAGLHAQVSLNGLGTIMNMEGEGYNRAGIGQQATFGFGEQERLYDQGAKEFIDGYLRAMTGAAATATEIQTYKDQWFPQFGDTAAVIQQKARGRLNAIKAMKSKAGRSWNPEWDSSIASLESQLGGSGAAQESEQVRNARAMLENWDSLPPIYKTPQIRRGLEAAVNGAPTGPASAVMGNRADDTTDDDFIDTLFPAEDDAPPAGVSPEEWAVMDEEDRAAFR